MYVVLLKYLLNFEHVENIKYRLFLYIAIYLGFIILMGCGDMIYAVAGEIDIMSTV